MAASPRSMKRRQNFPRLEGTCVVGYWDGLDCDYCHSPVAEGQVESLHKIGGIYVLIENVPAGVCTKCRARYYTTTTCETLDTIRRGHPNTDRELRVPVYTYPD